MKVALGTIEVSDEARKAIRKLKGGKGDATRQEVKEYLLNEIETNVLPNVGAGTQAAGAEEPQDQTEEERLEAAAEEQHANEIEGEPHGTAPEPVSGETLPPVPGPGDATGYTGGATAATGTSGTTPSTGDLGSDGTAGGTA